LVNALAATPKGGEIRVTAQKLHGADGREVEITVTDTGCGINPELQAHLFEKYLFNREKSGSSGLGLYICKTLVEANQGSIRVESQVNRGTAFHLAFPVSSEQ
jgi:signal transduction histidine kinase